MKVLNSTRKCHTILDQWKIFLPEYWRSQKKKVIVLAEASFSRILYHSQKKKKKVIGLSSASFPGICSAEKGVVSSTAAVYGFWQEIKTLGFWRQIKTPAKIQCETA